MPQNNLSEYQFAIMSLIQDEEMNGKEIRRHLQAHGVALDGPNFYQVMARLKSAGLLTCRREMGGDTTPRNGWYQATERGKTVWEATFEAYARWVMVVLFRKRKEGEIQCRTITSTS